MWVESWNNLLITWYFWTKVEPGISWYYDGSWVFKLYWTGPHAHLLTLRTGMNSKSGLRFLNQTGGLALKFVSWVCCPPLMGFLPVVHGFFFIISTTIQLPKLGIMKLSLSSNLNSVVVLGILVIQSKFECRLKWETIALSGLKLELWEMNDWCLTNLKVISLYNETQPILWHNTAPVPGGKSLHLELRERLLSTGGWIHMLNPRKGAGPQSDQLMTNRLWKPRRVSRSMAPDPRSEVLLFLHPHQRIQNLWYPVLWTLMGKNLLKTHLKKTLGKIHLLCLQAQCPWTSHHPGLPELRLQGERSHRVILVMCLTPAEASSTNLSPVICGKIT